MSNEKTFIFDSADAPKKNNAINAKTATLLGTGVAVLLGGTYLTMSEAEAAIPTPPIVANSELAEKSSTGSFGKFFLEESETAPVNTPKTVGKVFNPFTAPHAHSVHDEMSFAEAFAAARAETGAGGVFEWRGQVFATFYATEVDQNMNPTIDYAKVPYQQEQWAQYTSGTHTQAKDGWFTQQDGWIDPVKGVSSESATEGSVITDSRTHDHDTPETSHGEDAQPDMAHADGVPHHDMHSDVPEMDSMS
jgi:hypothetical protein